MAPSSGHLLARLKGSWKRVPPKRRSIITSVIKGVITIGAFYLLFTHQIAIKDEIEVHLSDGSRVTVTAGQALVTADGREGTLEVGPHILLDSGQKVRSIRCSAGGRPRCSRYCRYSGLL